MVDDGMMDRFAVTEVYGMHNFPGMPVGSFGTRPGAILAAADQIYITIDGKGGHAAKPHSCIDTVLVGAHIVTALQSIVGRNVDPLDAAVISICTFQAGSATNIIPDRCELSGTARSLSPQVRELLERRIVEVAIGTAALFGAKATATYERGYPVTVNHAAQTTFAASVASSVVGASKVEGNMVPTLGGEDFAFMLEARPGAFVFCGNGDSAGLHHPAYNFNDDAIPAGVSYWVRLVETAMPA
jgi:amidohydrolase